MTFRIRFLSLMVVARGAADFLKILCVLYIARSFCAGSWTFLSLWLGEAVNFSSLVQHHDHLLNPFSLQSCILLLYTPTSFLPQREAVLLQSTWTPSLLSRHCYYLCAKEYSLHLETLSTSLTIWIVIPSWAVPKLPMFPTHYLWRPVLSQIG